jgi:hypothetical protein
MSGGILDHLTQAAHICAGMGVSFDEAQEMVREACQMQAAHISAITGCTFREAEATYDYYLANLEKEPPTTIGNITFVDFRRR